ncbi:MAG: hypothetical protein LBP78_05065, partial [Acidaminococcales bacterium]|nr:hypothetical protein [Acidaminococcales bacterium]
MPKVIKSDSVEEGRLFAVELPEDAFSADVSDNGEVDYLRFFTEPAGVKPAGEDEYKKYYIDTNEKSAGGPGEAEQTPEEDAGEKPEDAEDAPGGLLAAAVAERVPPDEKAQKIIALAEEKAGKILENARREAESMRMKLAAEISEGEVKKEQAKNIATDIVEDANAEAGRRLAQAGEKARELFEEAKAGGQAEGFKAGKDEGYKQGLEKGMEEGKLAGREDGKKEGLIAGEAAGRAEGIESARREMAGQLAEATQKAK